MCDINEIRVSTCVTVVNHVRHFLQMHDLLSYTRHLVVKIIFITHSLLNNKISYDFILMYNIIPKKKCVMCDINEIRVTVVNHVRHFLQMHDLLSYT